MRQKIAMMPATPTNSHMASTVRLQTVSRLCSVQIHAKSRPAGDTRAEPHEWTVETDDYDQGMTEVRGAVPDGWVLLGVRVDR